MFRIIIPIQFILFLSVVVAGAAILSCNLRTGGAPENVEFPKEFIPLLEVYQAVQEDHVNKDNLNPTLLSRGAIRGMLQALDDPHAVYLDPVQFGLESSKFEGSFEGIGAEVTMRGGQVIIVNPIPDTPAEEAGIRPGDIILQVNGESIRGLSLTAVIMKIRGPEGTPVDLLVQRKNISEPLTVTIVRGVVKVPSLSLRVMSGGVGHLKIFTFSQNNGDDMKKVFERVEKNRVKGLILDLRNNLGGLVSAGIAVTSEFIDSELVMYQVDGEGNREEHYAHDEGLGKTIPMVVLVNEFSASASEFVAGALRDHDRAQLIGTKTYGKGSVNVQRTLADGSGVYYTIAKWYTPDGTLIEGEGIIPDFVVLPDPEGVEDPQLDQAIDILNEMISNQD